MSGWRVGDAGHTIFGPNNGAPSPETIATVRKRENAPVLAAAPELLEALELLQVEIRARYKMNVKKDFSLMVADAAATKAIRKAKGVQS